MESRLPRQIVVGVEIGSQKTDNKRASWKLFHNRFVVILTYIAHVIHSVSNIFEIKNNNARKKLYIDEHNKINFMHHVKEKQTNHKRWHLKSINLIIHYNKRGLVAHFYRGQSKTGCVYHNYIQWKKLFPNVNNYFFLKALENGWVYHLFNEEINWNESNLNRYVCKKISSWNIQKKCRPFSGNKHRTKPFFRILFNENMIENEKLSIQNFWN